MKIAGIICEYNPFHNGHLYHIEQTKSKYGATHIIAVMSGNFTQRGDVAVIDKFRRAEIALQNGADLVIELPVAFALSSAEQFAQGACHILNSLGCVDMLSFGSECGDIDLLKETAGAVHYAMETDDFQAFLRKGSSYPQALQQTIEKYYTDDIIEALTTPNNTLAIEYIRALDNLGSTIEPVTIKRYGADHDSHNESFDTVVSASQIRKMLANNEDVSMLMPAISDGNFASLENIEIAILSKLRSMSKSDLEKTPNVVNGMENRLYKAIRAARTLPELLFLIKTKRYTMARIRRIILSCYLGISKNDLKNPPAYVRILGMNNRGKEILGNCKCELPIDTSLMNLLKSGDIAKKQAVLEEQAGNLYALACDKKMPCGLDFTTKPIIL